jgi:hypothetical protein
MKAFLYRALSISLSLASVAVSADDVKFDRELNHVIINLVLDVVFADLAKVRTGKDFERLFVSRLSPRDRQPMARLVRGIEEFPKFQRLNRGFSYQYGGKKMEFVIEDALHGRFTLNGQNWVYDSSAPLEMQIDILKRRLEKKEASFFHLLFPEANAIEPVSTLLVGIAIGGIVIPLVGYIAYEFFGSPIKTHVLEMRCGSEDPNTLDPKIQIKCKEWFDTIQLIRDRAERSKANAAEPIYKNEKKGQVAPLSDNHVCPDPKAEKTRFWIKIKDDRTKAETVNILHYEKGDPIYMTVANAEAPDLVVYIYKLDKKKRIIARVIGIDGTVLSRESQNVDAMTPKMLEQFDPHDKTLLLVSNTKKIKCDPDSSQSTAAVVNAVGGVPVEKLKEMAADPNKSSKPLLNAPVTGTK